MVGLQQAALQQQQQNAAKEEEPRSFLMKRGVSWQAVLAATHPGRERNDHISHPVGKFGGPSSAQKGPTVVVDISFIRRVFRPSVQAIFHPKWFPCISISNSACLDQVG